MKITKKLLSFSIISLIIFSNFSFLVKADYYEDELDYSSSIDYYKNEILKKDGAEKIINAVDSLIEKIKDNELALNKLQEKINAISKKSKYEELVLAYIDHRVALELDRINSKKMEESISKFNNPTISREDKKKFEDELVKLQLIILENWTQKLQTFTDYFEKQMNIEEKGSMKMNINIDQEQFGQLKSTLNLNNYTANTSNFDSKLKGEIAGLFESSLKDEDEVKLNLNGLIDFISKDGNIYLLLENLNITENQNTQKFQKYIDMLEKVSNQNKYVKFGDENKEMALKVLNSFSVAKIKTTLSKPMFSAYKKEGNKYYMVPTKYSCDSFKQLGNLSGIMFGVSNYECSDNEYKEILAELSKAGELYMEIGDKTKVGFNFAFDNSDKVKANGFLTFDDKNIIETVLSVIPDQVKNPNEKLTLNYIRNSKLDLVFYADEGRKDITLNSKLDSNNRFTFIDFISKDVNNYSNAKLKLENNVFNGNFDLDSEISGNIDGTTNLDNTLKSLDIKYSNEDKSLNGKINYLNHSFAIENHFKDDYSSLDLLLNLKCNPDEKTLDSGNLDILVKTKNYTTNKFIESFKMNLSLKDTIINGYSVIKGYDGKDEFAIKTSGKYEKDYLELKNKMGFLSPLNNMDKVIGTLNLKSDLRNGLDNVNIYFDASIKNKKIIDFELDNTGTIEYKKTEIIAPANTIDAKDLKIENNGYDDDL